MIGDIHCILLGHDFHPTVEIIITEITQDTAKQVALQNLKTGGLNLLMKEKEHLIFQAGIHKI